MTNHSKGYLNWLRERVGNQLIFVVSAYALILDAQGHVLLHQGSNTNCWALPGLPKELDESLGGGLLRHIREQCGLTVTIKRLLGVYTHPKYRFTEPNGAIVQPWALGFVCQVVGDSQPAQGYRFHTLDDLPPVWPELFCQMLADAQENAPYPKLENAHAEAQTLPYFPILRAHIPREPLILPGAIAVVWDEAGRMLVTQRSYENYWDIPGGFSDLGETATHTALREIHEETGLIIEPLRILGVYSNPKLIRGEYPNGDIVQAVGLLIEGRVIGGDLKPDGDETRAAAFLSLDELGQQPNIRPLMRQILTDLAAIEDAPFIH